VEKDIVEQRQVGSGLEQPRRREEVIAVGGRLIGEGAGVLIDAHQHEAGAEGDSDRDALLADAFPPAA
jgi:hypothetical protein